VEALALEIVEKEVIAMIGVLRSSDRRLWSLTLDVAVCGDDCHADAAEKKISNAVERKILVEIVHNKLVGGEACFVFCVLACPVVCCPYIPIPTKQEL
jgi:hypothetical protein